MANGTSGPVPGHRILLEERSRLTITGVTDVLSFDEESVTAETDLGTLTVRAAAARDPPRARAPTPVIAVVRKSSR